MDYRALNEERLQVEQEPPSPGRRDTISVCADRDERLRESWPSKNEILLIESVEVEAVSSRKSLMGWKSFRKRGLGRLDMSPPCASGHGMDPDLVVRPRRPLRSWSIIPFLTYGYGVPKSRWPSVRTSAVTATCTLVVKVARDVILLAGRPFLPCGNARDVIELLSIDAEEENGNVEISLSDGPDKRHDHGSIFDLERMPSQCMAASDTMLDLSTLTDLGLPRNDADRDFFLNSFLRGETICYGKSLR